MQDDFNAAQFLGDTFCGLDFSDAPASYGEADHIITSAVQLGVANTVDAGAVNDDSDAGDDGITIPTLTQGQTATITAEVTGAGGYLQGWIDFNGDGDFDDAGEQVAADLQDGGTGDTNACLLYTSPSPRDQRGSRMPSSA